MRSTYVATQLSPDDYHSLGIRAAELGMSKSGLLRSLVADFLSTKPSDTLSNQTAPLPRADQSEIVAPDPRYVALTVAVDPVEEHDAETHYIESATARDGDSWRTTHVVLPMPDPPAPVITAITPRQLRLELSSRGLLAGVEAAIANLPEPQKTGALIEWEYANQFLRLHPTVSAIAATIGISSETLDDIFTQASAF